SFDDPHAGKLRVMNNTLYNSRIARYQGGVRAQFFGLESVELMKHPLMYLDGVLKPIEDAHTVDRARIADISCVLYHYKFVDRFIHIVEGAVRKGNYSGGSYEYKHYHRALQQNPHLCLKTETASTLHHVNQLVDEDFLHVTERFRAWVATNGVRMP